MKRALALILTVVLTVGMAVTGYAANPKILDVGEGALSADYNTEITPGTQIKIELMLDAFTFDQSGVTSVTKSMLSTANIDVKTTYTKGKELIDKIEIKDITKNGGEKYAVIYVNIVDKLTSTKEEKVDIRVNLYMGNKRKDSVQLQFTVAGETEYVDSSYDYIDISNGQILEADEFVREIEVALDEYVSIVANLSKGKRYSGYVEYGVTTAADEKVVVRYDQIKDIVRLHTTNLKGVGNIVKIDMYDVYHVYNKEGKYVGTTEDMLPYSELYYLADEKISMTGSSANNNNDDDDSDDDDDDDDGSNGVVEEPSPSTPPVSTTPSYSGSSGTDNPDTGAGSMVGIAMVVGLMAAAVAIGATKK